MERHQIYRSVLVHPSPPVGVFYRTRLPSLHRCSERLNPIPSHHFPSPIFTFAQSTPVLLTLDSISIFNAILSHIQVVNALRSGSEAARVRRSCRLAPAGAFSPKTMIVII